MRPIDGDALKNQIRHMSRTVNPDLVQYSLVQAIIADMPTLTPQNEWVSVEERLPPPKQNVLAYSLSGGIAEADYADGVWMQYRWSAVMDDVTHWMPLPVPPGKEIISQRRRGQLMSTVYQCKHHDNCGQRVDWSNPRPYRRPPERQEDT